MPTAYRVETAKQGRAGCQNSECKKAAVKIQAGELRFGVLVEIKEHQSWQWKHWGCVTPQVISNMQSFTEGDLEMVDGYEELSEEHQEKVKRALEQGHVDDEDWKGDVEVNRPGEKGFRKKTPKPKKTKDAEADGDDVQAASPTKPAKKRGRPAKADAEDDEPEAKPAAKKARAKPKKATKKEEDEDEEEAAEEPAPRAKRGKPSKKAAKAVKAAEEAEEAEEAADELEVDGEDDAEEEKPAPKKRGKKPTTATDAAPSKAPSKRGRPKKEVAEV